VPADEEEQKGRPRRRAADKIKWQRRRTEEGKDENGKNRN